MGLRAAQKGSNLLVGIKQMASFDHLSERCLNLLLVQEVTWWSER